MRKRIALIIAALMLLGIGAGIAYASIPGSDGVIHGCYKNSNPAQGALIAIDSSASCPSGYTALNWNQTGPQGPQGMPGISGYELVSQQYTGPFPVNPDLLLTVDCPSGKSLIWEGGVVDNPSAKAITRLDVALNQGGLPFSARVSFDNSQGDVMHATVLATCAFVN